MSTYFKPSVVLECYRRRRHILRLENKENFPNSTILQFRSTSPCRQACVSSVLWSSVQWLMHCSSKIVKRIDTFGRNIRHLIMQHSCFFLKTSWNQARLSRVVDYSTNPTTLSQLYSILLRLSKCLITTAVVLVHQNSCELTELFTRATSVKCTGRKEWRPWITDKFGDRSYPHPVFKLYEHCNIKCTKDGGCVDILLQKHCGHKSTPSPAA